jgi:flagellin
LTNLTNVNNAISGSIEKLSSGLRINSAADDPAGLIISNSLGAQVGGLNQAISNSQDATNVIKTATGALTEVNNLLDTVRQLALNAANTGANDAIATQADQTQITAALTSINRIANQTQFGDKNLLNGTSGITSSVTNTTDIAGISIGGTFGGGVTQSGNVSVTVVNAATTAQASGTVTYASVNASISTAGGASTGSGGTIVINGQSIVVAGSDTVQTLINKINNIAGSTGVSAAFSSANSSGGIVLTQQNYGANFKITESESGNLLATTTGTVASGLNATVAVTASVLVNGAVTTVLSTFSGGRSTTDSGLRVTDTSGNSILLTNAGNSTGTSAATVASVQGGALQFQIGANAGQTVSANLGNVTTSNLGNTSVAGSNLSLLDVTTATGANNAIIQTDEAISQVSQLAANLGAFQTETLASTINYLGVSVENLSAAESQVKDTNVAQEVVNLTKNQIIQQAATSVLAQANTAPQGILKLLQ